jgi:hypothetical protein
MKKLILLLSAMLYFFLQHSYAQNVGIGTTTPQAAFNVAEGRTVLFGLDSNGAGIKMMWMPSKGGAFRAGQTSPSGWANSAIGYGSFAVGYHSIASGEVSIAMGNGNAVGAFSTAINGFSSGLFSVAIGANTYSYSAYEIVFGRWNTIYTPASTTDWVGADRLFSIGNGTSAINRSDAFAVLKNGNIGIGLTAPLAKLHISGSLLVESAINFHSQGTHLEWNKDNGGGKTYLLNQKGLGSGGLVLGEVDGTNNVSPILTLSPNGNANLTGTLTQNSDERLKTNIHPLQTSLDNLEQLSGYTYNWKEATKDNEQQIGLLAQEVKKIYPQLVKQNAAGELSVNYIGLVPVLIESIKAQQKQIEQQNQRIEELDKRIKKIVQ